MPRKKAEPQEPKKKAKKPDKPKGSLGNLEGKVHKLSVEDQLKGSEAGVKARLRKRTLREGLLAVLSVPNNDKELGKLFQQYGMESEENPYLAKTIISLIQLTMAGDMKALKMLCEILGIENAPQDINLNVTGSGVQFYLPEKERDEEDEG